MKTLVHLSQNPGLVQMDNILKSFPARVAEGGVILRVLSVGLKGLGWIVLSVVER